MRVCEKGGALGYADPEETRNASSLFFLLCEATERLKLDRGTLNSPDNYKGSEPTKVYGVPRKESHGQGKEHNGQGSNEQNNGKQKT